MGVAASGAAVNDRIRAGHDAAIRAAIEHWEDPNIIEATLHLGHLEGVWANIFERRKQLYDSMLKELASVWSKLFDKVDLPTLIKAVRQQAGLANEKAGSSSIDYATALVLTMLQNLLMRSDWQKLRLAVADALTSGMAAGRADALELLADKIDVTGFNFAKAFTKAKSEFENDPTVLTDVDQWLSRLLQLVAADTGRHLAEMADEGDPTEEMDKYLQDQLAGGDSRSFVSFIDQLVHGAITVGILGFLRLNGVGEVWFITAGDEFVCPQCDEIEGQNPYPLSAAPEPPIHINCRCTLYSIESLPSSLLDDYID